MTMPSIDTGPIDRLTKLYDKRIEDESVKKNIVQREIDALSKLKAKVDNLETSIENMKEANDFLARTVSITATDDPYVTATADPSTLVGDYQFEVVTLATQSVRSGSANVGKSISTSSDVSGVTLNTMPVHTQISTGFFTVNGVRIEIYDPSSSTGPTETYNVANTASLQTLMTKIQDATSNAVTLSYNNTTDKITITSASEISLGTSADTSNFLKVTKLIGNGTSSVTSQSALGTVQLTKDISASNLTTTVTSGQFKINGYAFDYNINSDSIDSLMKKINASGADVFINYDPISDKFSLLNQQTGKLDVTVQDVTGNLLEAMGLNSTATLTKGTNAQFKINGGSTITTTSNILKDNVHGVAGLTVTAKKVGTDTISVAQDPTASRKLLDDFIEKFNDVQSYIKIQTKVVISTGGKVIKGDLANNLEVKNLARDLRSKVFQGVTSLASSDIKRLPDMYIDFVTDSNELTVKDSAKLNDILKSSSSSVSLLFSDSTDGFATSMDTYLSNLTKTDNVMFKDKTTKLSSKIVQFDDKIKKLEEQYTKTLDDIKYARTQMEIAFSDMQRQMSYLRSRFG